MSFAKPVITKKLPERITAGNTDQFVRGVARLLEGDRPHIVFDFSNVRQFDSAGVALLLDCIEEVLKRNGDLKLASVPASAAAVLRISGVDSLFEIFEDAHDAIESFYRIPGFDFQDAPEAYAQSIPFVSGDEMAA